MEIYARRHARSDWSTSLVVRMSDGSWLCSSDDGNWTIVGATAWYPPPSSLLWARVPLCSVSR